MFHGTSYVVSLCVLDVPRDGLRRVSHGVSIEAHPLDPCYSHMGPRYGILAEDPELTVSLYQLVNSISPGNSFLAVWDFFGSRYSRAPSRAGRDEGEEASEDAIVCPTNLLWIHHRPTTPADNMVLAVLIAFGAVTGASEGLKASQSKARREEHRSRKNNLVVHVVKSSEYTQILEGRRIVLSGDKVNPPGHFMNFLSVDIGIGCAY